MNDARWIDDLIWCPSQCYYPLTRPDGTAATLYLRWRHDDPWTAAIIGGTYPNLDLDDWTDIEVPYFRDDQLDELKAAVLRVFDPRAVCVTPKGRSE